MKKIEIGVWTDGHELIQTFYSIRDALSWVFYDEDGITSPAAYLSVDDIEQEESLAFFDIDFSKKCLKKSK